MDENIVKYYEYLKSKGLDVPPTVEQFQNTLQDKASSDKYYAYLQNKKASMPNLDIAPDANSFYDTLKKKEEQAPQEQLQSQQGQEQLQSGMASPSAVPSSVSKSAGQGRYAGGLTAANIDQAVGSLDAARNAKPLTKEEQANLNLQEWRAGLEAEKKQVEEAYKGGQGGMKPAPFATSREEAESPLFKEKEAAFLKGVEERTAKNQAESYLMVAPNINTSLNLADLESRLSTELSNVPTGTTSVNLIGLKNEIESKYKVLEGDYLEYLKAVNADKFSNYSSRLSTIQGKDGDLSLEDEKFLKSFREEAISMRKKADQYRVEKIKTTADFDKWNKMSPLILNEAKKIQNELSKYVNEDGSYKSVADAQKAKALSSKLDEVKRSLIQLQEQTGVTSKVIDDINSSYDSLIDNELIESQEWDKYTELRNAERLSEEEKQIRVKMAEEGNVGQKAALVLMSFFDTIGSGVVSMAETPKVLADAFGSSDTYGWTDALYDVATDVITERSGRTQALDSKSSVMNVMDIFAKGAGNVVQFATGGELTGALKAGSKLAANAGVAGTAYLMSVGEEYRQALAAGVDPQEAAIYANMISIATAMTEVAVPDFKYFTPADRKSIIAAMANKGIGAKEAFKGFAKNVIIEAPKTGLKEAGEEVLTELTGSTVKEFINAAKGERLYKDTFNAESMYEAALSGFIVGGGLQSIKRGVAPSDEELPVPRSIGENADAVIQAITMIDPSMASEATKDIEEIKKIVTGLNGIPAYQDLGDNEKNFVVYQLMKKRNLESAMKETGMSDESTISEIKKIESEINEVYAGKKIKLNNQQQNAVQEQATSEIPLQPEAIVGEEMAQGEPTAESEVVTEEGVKEKVGNKPLEIGDKVLDSNGAEYEIVGFVTSRKGTQQAEVKISKRTDAQIQEDAKRNIFNRNENRLLYKDFNDPRFIKEQSIAISQEISDLTAVNNSSQGSTTLDLADLRKAESEVVTQESVKEKVSVLDSPDTITESIVALTPEEKAGVTFLREDGTEVDIDGNEDELANAYVAATQVAENDRTDSQRSAIQAVETSLADEIQAEQLDAIVEQETGSTDVTEEVEATAKELDKAQEENPTTFEEFESEGKIGAKMRGGIIDATIAAIEGDKKNSVKTPSTLKFLPRVLELVHLARNQKEKGKIISSGFDSKRASIDSPIPGIYFSSEDWSTVDRFGRSKKDSVYTKIDNDGLVYFDSTKELRSFLKENNLPSEGQTLNAAQIATLKNMGIKGILLRHDFASASRNELIVIDESIIKGVSDKPTNEITKLPSSFSNTKDIAKAYHKAKADGSNPKLVQAVESLLSQGTRFRLDDDTTNQEVVTVENNDLIKQNKIEGGFLNEQQSSELQKEIESKYNVDGPKFGPENEDIRTNIYTYDTPLAEKNVNGVNLRIAQGLLEKDKSGKNRSTYLLYANGKIAGKFYSVDDIKKVVKLIEDNLVKSIGEGTQESKFRLDADKEGAADKKVVKAMNAMPTQEKEFVEPTGIYGEVQVNAIDESRSSTKDEDSEELAKKLGLKSISDLNRPIEDFNGMPVILGMSDILASGTYTDSMGNKMRLNGGILFGAFGRNIAKAWAGVQRSGAENQMNDAIKLYNANKELFNRLWKEGKLPMGHVPMVIMRMGNSAINSNEAAFRWLSPYVASLPLKNRKAALAALKGVLSSKVDKDSASSWLIDFNTDVASGELASKEDVVAALEDMLASKEVQAIEKKKKSVETVLNAVKKKKTIEEVVDYVNAKTEKIMSNIVLNHIKNNKITTLDGLLDSVVDQSNKRAKGDNTAMPLPVRAFIFSLVYSKGSPKTPSLAPIKALMNGVKNFKSEYFTTDYLYNAIGEPSMLKTNQGDVVAVVGIDVLNPEVSEADHPNYGFGPKGRLIATISNPTQGIDVFAEFKAKASRIFKKTSAKEESKVKYPDPEKVASQVGGAFFMDKAFRMARVMKGEIDDLNLLIGKLRFAFPNVSVTTTKEEFDEIMKDETVRMRVKEGKIIYGVTKDGKIYVNPDQVSLATPIHEFGHIWIDYLRSDASGKKGTELLNKGLALVDGTKEHKAAIKKYGDTELAREEALVELMATKGSTIINSAKESQFKSWMNAVFKFIKETFVANSKSVTYDQIKTLSLDEFINIGLADLFRGSEISAKFSASQSEQASKARLSAGNDMKTAVSIIEKGRANGISDKAITISLSRKGFTTDEIDTAFKSTTRTLSKAALSEETLPGYDVLMEKVKKEAEASSKKDKAEINKALENSIKTIQAGKIYAAATDVQREQLIREVRRAFKKREKSAPSTKMNVLMGLGRVIIGGIVDVKKITMAEYDLMKKEIMDYERGAKNALKSWTAKGKILSNEMRELASSKKITLTQAAVVMKKFSRVNMFDEDSVDDFITYMKKVFSDAEYADRISKLSSLLPKAKKNIDKKIGIARNLQAPLRRMLAISPSFVPDDVLSTYENIVKMFAQSGAVITPAERSSVIDDVNKVLLSVDEKSNKITEMSIILDEFENKVFDENGILNYSETTKAMLKDDLITVEDYEFMRDNKRSINKSIKDANKVVSQADQDAEAAKQQKEKKALIDSIKKSSIVLSDMFSEDEKKLGKDLAELIKTNAIESLTNSELNNLYKLIQTINNGYMPAYAYRVKSKLSSIVNAVPVTQAISKSGIAVISKAVAGVKSLFSKKRDTALQAIRRGTLLDIDKTLGNFMSRPIFDNIFRKSADAQAKLKAGTNSIRQRMDDAAEAVLKSLNNNGNAFVESSFKTYAYMIQLEYESNKGSKSVNPASKFIDATIAAIKKGKTKFSEKDAAILEKIKKQYSTDGEIDIKKLYDSFNSAEKKAIRVAQAIDKSVVDKAEFTAVVIRGEKFSAINNHIHLNTIKEDEKSDIAAASQVVTDYQKSTRPSSKSMSLVSRTGEVSPLNFDFYSAVKKGSTSVLVDYYMTPAIREAKQTINQVEKNLNEKQGGITKDEQKVINAISKAYDEATENLLLNSFVDDSLTAKAINILSKNGYRAALAGIPRATAELASNFAYATIVDPSAMITAYKYRDIIMSSAGLDVMLNSDSFQSNRVYSGQTLSGKLIDSNLLSQVAGMGDTRAKADIVNRMQQIYNMSAKKYVNSVEFIADTLISTPDKMIIRPIWFGSFANQFKKVTGSNVDFEKIASNDKAYMERYKDAIAKSREVADDASVMAGASDNAYTGILKGVVKPNQNSFARSMNIFNNYMTRFVTYEYLASRTAINALVGNGTISPLRGGAILAGVTSRMMVYTMLTKVLGGAMTSLVLGALGFDYEDEDEEKTALQLAGQSIGSALTSLLVGRDFGNVARNILNYGVEYINANYLEDLRTGEYDPYKDSMQMSIIPQDPTKMKAEKMIQSVAGPLAPAVGTSLLVIKKIAEEPKKEKEAIERSDIETNVMIPLKIAGTLGLVPLYKDINKAVQDYTYQSLRDEDKGSSEPPMSKELMKKYYPDLYNKMYKSNPAKEQQEKRIKDRKEMIKKRKEDAIKSKLRR